MSCSLIRLDNYRVEEGNLLVLEKQLPFEIKRFFAIHDVQFASERGSHSHKECHQLMIAASGSFSVEVDDGHSKYTFNLNNPLYGLHVPPGVWAKELNFSNGAICLVYASHSYNEDDYIRDYDEFLKSK